MDQTQLDSDQAAVAAADAQVQHDQDQLSADQQAAAAAHTQLETDQAAFTAQPVAEVPVEGVPPVPSADSAPAPEVAPAAAPADVGVIETVTYPDGTQATGVAPLPTESPVERTPATILQELEDHVIFWGGEVLAKARALIGELRSKL